MAAEGTIYVATQDQQDRAAHLVQTYPRPCRVTIAKGRQRSTEQNAYLFGGCYRTILREAGEHLAGWTAEDLHEYFKGECFGWEVVEGFGQKRKRPVHRSSTMNKVEFSEYIMLVQQKAAELGIVILDPDEFTG